jgi:predicted nucleic acid-binding protein
MAAPDVLRVEVISVLRRQPGRGTLPPAQAAEALDDLLALPLVMYPTAVLLTRVWQLRDKFTPYDACYAALAEALGCTLLTADQRVARAPGVRCELATIEP